MSVQAISWAYTAPVANPGTKFLLVTLANFADEWGVCWPGQDTLAAMTAQSERKVRQGLAELEDEGLIVKVARRRDDGSRRSDVIVLVGFGGRRRARHAEDHAAVDLPDVDANHREKTINRQILPVDGPGLFPPSEGGDQPANNVEPTGKSCRTNRQIMSDQPANPAGIYKDEPSIEPSREPEAAEARARDCDFSKMVASLAEAVGAPEIVDFPWWRIEAAKGVHLAQWRASGLDDERILDVARAHALDYPEPPKGPKALDKAMAAAARRIAHPGGSKPAATQSEQITFFADWVASGRFMPPAALTSSMRRALIDGGHVTDQQLRTRGL